MLLGPIFRVELVSTARRGRYFLLRAVYGLLILLVLWASYAETSSWNSYSRGTSIQAAAQLAVTFFASFTMLQMLAILFVGPAMAVGTIATERERRTIEYLFVSDLSNAEIVLGKLGARLLLLGQFVLVGLPILFIFRLLGGIPANLLVATFLIAGSTAMLVTSLSLCVSVWSPRARDATVRVYLLLAVLLIVPMICFGMAAGGVGFFQSAAWQKLGMPAVNFLLSINPLWALKQIIGSRSALGASLDMQLVLETVTRQLLTSLGCVLLATAAVRRVHLRWSTRGEVGQRRWRWSPARLRWTPAMGSRPMIWKELFAATASTRLGLVGTICFGIILLVVLGLALTFFLKAMFQMDGWRTRGFLGYLTGQTGVLGTGILLLLAVRAAAGITHEKERDCWTSLLATPLTGREIIQAKMLGNLYWLRWPFLLLLLTWLLGAVLEPDYLSATVFMAITFFITASFVTGVGLNYSFRLRTTLHSMGATLGTVVFVGGGYLFCCCTVMVGSHGSGDEMAIGLAPCIPFLLAFPSVAIPEPDVLGETLPVAYAFGIIGYAVVAFVLYVMMADGFDQISGRSHPDGRPTHLPPPQYNEGNTPNQAV